MKTLKLILLLLAALLMIVSWIVPFVVGFVGGILWIGLDAGRLWAEEAFESMREKLRKAGK